MSANCLSKWDIPSNVSSPVWCKRMWRNTGNGFATPIHDFIQARCQADESGGEVLEKHRSKIEAGRSAQSHPRFSQGHGQPSRTAELLMTYVENDSRFTHEYRDIDERFYSSVESALDELAARLRGEARELYPQFSERLARVEQMSDGIGWGFHDFVSGLVGQLADELGEQ